MGLPRGPRQRKGVPRQEGRLACLTTGCHGQASSGPSTEREPRVQCDLLDPLGGDTAFAWTVESGTLSFQGQGHLSQCCLQLAMTLAVPALLGAVVSAYEPGEGS